MVEYFILFALVAALSLLFIGRIRDPFYSYISKATKAMTEQEAAE